MCRTAGTSAELTRKRGNPAPEMVLPNPIDHDPGGEWIFRARDPVCEGGAGRLSRWSLRIYPQDLGETGQHLFTWIVIVAATEDEGFGRRATASQGHGQRERCWLPESVLLFEQLFPPGIFIGRHFLDQFRL